MSASLETKGLKEARENLYKLSEDLGIQITREALRNATLIINRAVRASTYTTFTRRTGRIRAGFGVRVGLEPKDNVISAVVVQYPQATGPRLKAARERERDGIAYWWRFLEFGTQGRRTTRTPKHLRLGRIARGAKQQAAEAAYSAGRSLGDIAARPWVRPAFNASVAEAVKEFADEFRRVTDEEVNKLPK